MRVDGWEIRLLDVINDHDKRPFTWGGTGGGSDCFQMAMDGVKAVTGVDPWEKERGTYKSASGAARRFKKNGYTWLADCYADTFTEIAPAMAQRGDLGIVEDAGGVDVSVIVYDQFAYGKSPEGRVRVPVTKLKSAYRVD